MAMNIKEGKGGRLWSKSSEHWETLKLSRTYVLSQIFTFCLILVAFLQIQRQVSLWSKDSVLIVVNCVLMINLWLLRVQFIFKLYKFLFSIVQNFHEIFCTLSCIQALYIITHFPLRCISMFQSPLLTAVPGFSPEWILSLL